MSIAAIRLVVSDVDGTLIGPDRSLAPSTVAAAARLRAAGIPLALVSSRPPRGLDMIAHALGLDAPRAGYNGAVIEDAAGTVIEQHCIAAQVARAVVEMLQAARVDVWVFARDAWLLTDDRGPYVRHESEAVAMRWQQVPDLSPCLDTAHKIMASSADHARIASLERELQKRVGDRAAVHRSQPYYLDITHPDADKGKAAGALARLLDVPLGAMACLGDMSNDLPMFAIAGLAIAMGNASDAVKRAAHATTPANDAGGWGAAIDRYVLPAH